VPFLPALEAGHVLSAAVGSRFRYASHTIEVNLLLPAFVSQAKRFSFISVLLRFTLSA